MFQYCEKFFTIINLRFQVGSLLVSKTLETLIDDLGNNYFTGQIVV